MLVVVGEGDTGEDRMMDYGLELLPQDDGSVMVDGVGFDSEAERAGFDFDQIIAKIGVPVERPARQWFFIPALLLLAGIITVQRRRRDGEEANTLLCLDIYCCSHSCLELLPLLLLGVRDLLLQH